MVDPSAKTAGGVGWSGPMPGNVGPYRVLGVLGEGGFGVVYEAEQAQPVRRRVAVKVIKPGMDSAGVVGRFEAERQALAVMDHPCIAKVFDGGVTGPEQGSRPYFVMELVKGEPITAFCDTHTLSVGERVGLFIRVCEAVQHAHAKGVVHRDLKPSNVLVAYDGDGRAMPKVIDFGVAKALNQRLSEHTVFTERGQLIGTPEYMSPEQAEMSGLDIDTRADVYSLGVLLYELLTGVLPFDPKSLRAAAFAEIQRIIREVEPPRPSTRLSTVLSGAAAEEGTRIVKARHTDARSLAGVLRRDLDWVVMKCLEKDRERRYATATALGEDLRRYLEHEPVEAGPPGVGYRVGKFVRRNRPTLVVASIAFAMLAGATCFSVLAATRAERARLSEAARLEQLERVTRYQRELLGEFGSARIGPVLREALLSEASDAARRTGAALSDAAASRQRVALELDPLDMNAVAAAMLDRAVLSRAEHRAREAIGSDGAVLAALLEGLAGAYWGLGDRARALELQQDIMAIRMGALGPAHRDTIRTQSKVALWHWVMGRYAESTPHAEEVYARALEHLPPHDPDRLAATHVMGLAGAAHGTAAREALLLRALDGQEHVLGPGHPDTIWSMLGLVNLYHGQGRSDDAGPIVRDAVDRSVRMLGRDEEVTLYAQRYLRRQLEREGDLNGAIALVREIVSTRDRVFGPTHPGSITELRALARLLGARGDLVEARRVAEQHVARNRQAFGDTHPETRDARAFLARLQVETAGAAASPDDVPAPSAALPSPHSGSTPAP